MKPLLAILLFASVMLAGCSGDNGGGDDDESPSLTATTTAPPNRAPTAALNASATSGPSPLNVTFSVAGADADNDTLSWTLTFGDGNQTNGTSLPANATHTYATAVNLTVQAILSVTDGTLNATANVTISITAAAPTTSQTVFEGEVAASCGTGDGCYVVGAEACLGWVAHQQGIDCVWFELTPELAGLPFVTESAGDVDLEFRSDCELTGDKGELYGADGQEEGEVPAGAGCVVLFDYTGSGLLRLLVG